jgi:hypothetical protein
MNFLETEYTPSELVREVGRLVWFAIAAYCLFWVFMVLVGA